MIVGVPSDMPVVGFGGRTVNYLRLYSARASDEFDMAIFNNGDYFRAVEQKITSEAISKVLYPSDAVAVGRGGKKGISPITVMGLIPFLAVP